MSTEPSNAPSLFPDQPPTPVGSPMTAPTERPAASALLPFCRKPHRLIDGVPIAHRCRIVPPESISAAIAGDYGRAVMLLAQTAARGPLPNHPGIWRLRRR
jgi:hypothetical protein